MTNSIPEILPEISSAETLPGKAYNSIDLFEQSKESIFASSWQFICDSSSVRTPGQVYPFVLLEKYLDEPLVLTRDYEDRLRCLSNVCTHRGALLAEHPCQLKNFRCKYHGRKFTLDGSFISMPEFEETKNFPTECDNLTQLELEQFGEFLFTSLNPKLPFGNVFKPIQEQVGWMPFASAKYDAQLSRDYLVQSNWMLYCDNYLEGFHIPYVHPSLSDVIDYGEYTTEVFDYCNLQLGIARGSEFTFELPKDSPDYGKQVAAYYYWVFPNLMLNFYPWGISVNVVKPLEVNLTKVSFIAYVWDRSKLSTGAGAELDRVEREDEQIVESVQLGVSSRFYSSGRFSPTREQGVHHFHRLIAQSFAQ